MYVIEHYRSSLEKVKKKYPELYEREKEAIEKLLMALHEWLDWYFGKKGEDEEGLYDFTGAQSFRHRAKRHHIQGIGQAVEFFGRQYEAIIREEAERHIKEDMGDLLLFKEDYKAIGFWKHQRGL